VVIEVEVDGSRNADVFAAYKKLFADFS